jgi:hypothetical protein
VTDSALPLPPRPRANPLAAPLFITIYGVVAMLAFALGVAMGARGWDTLILGVALVTSFVGVVPLALDWSRPDDRRQILITLIVLSYSVFLVLPILTGYFLSDIDDGAVLNFHSMAPQTIVAGQLAALMGLSCMLLGFYLPIGRFLAALLPRPTREWSPSAALGVAAVMIPLAIALYAVGQLGLVPKQAGSGVLGSIAFWSFLGIALLTLTYLRYRDRMALIMGLALVLPTMLFNFFTGSKRLFLTPAFMVALAFILVERRLRKSWVIGGFLLLVILYPTSQFYRHVVLQGNRLRAMDVLSNPGRTAGLLSQFFSQVEFGEYFKEGLLSAGSRLNGLSALCVIVRDTPSKVPFQMGRSIAFVPLAYVPRVLWPGKPGLTIGQWVTDNYLGPNIRSHTGPSWVGEFYFNFGYLGIGVGMLLMGVFFRILQELLFFKGAPLPAQLAGVAVLSSVLVTPGGALPAPINGVIFNCTSVAIVHLVVTLFSNTRRPIGLHPPGGNPA